MVVFSFAATDVYVLWVTLWWISWTKSEITGIRTIGWHPSLHPVTLIAGLRWIVSFVPLCLVTPDQAADDHVKIKITKYKTGSSLDGEFKVQEMGEGDPQWQHIKDVVKEQLEKAGLKAEGMKEEEEEGQRLSGAFPSLFSSSNIPLHKPLRSHF